MERASTSKKITQPYRFADGYQDPTGLYHFSARYYDPNVGRFTQPVPSGQEKNPYLYAEGDPVNRIDPSGLAPWDVLGTAGDIVGAGAKVLQDGTKGLRGDVAGFVVGAGFGAACETVMQGAPYRRLGPPPSVVRLCASPARGLPDR